VGDVVRWEVDRANFPLGPGPCITHVTPPHPSITLPQGSVLLTSDSDDQKDTTRDWDFIREHDLHRSLRVLDQDKPTSRGKRPQSIVRAHEASRLDDL